MAGKKHLPPWLQNTFLQDLLKSTVFIFGCYWVFQGMLYMDWRERLMKVILDLTIAGILFLSGVSILPALVVAHTLNMFLNGHFFAMITHMGYRNLSPGDFLKYVDGLKSRLACARWVSGAAAYGSLSRGQYKKTSDIDVRVVPKSGMTHWLSAMIWTVAERTRALIAGFPLDLYLFEMPVLKRKMRTDEAPVIFADANGEMAGAYAVCISYSIFHAAFKKNNMNLVS